MKFEIVRDELLDALNDVMKAISQKVAIPILTGIKIEVDEKGMSMTGSDSDTSSSSLPIFTRQSTHPETGKKDDYATVKLKVIPSL